MTMLPNSIEGFFFRRMSASGWGLLRISWGITAFLSLLIRAPDVVRYYSDAGLIPPGLGHLVFRDEWRFVILDFFGSPPEVIALYLVFLALLVCVILGIRPRFTVIASVVLLFSFHERNLLILSGGDTLLRNVGFLLAVSPELRAFSVSRLRAQWIRWKAGKSPLPPLTMSIWPYRLLLWQMIVLYCASFIDKLGGSMWIDGTTMAAVLHHPDFARFPGTFADTLAAFSPLLTYSALLYELCWFGLLIPRPLTNLFPKQIPRISLKRWLLLGGVAFHGGIFLLMDVGSFSIASLAAYPGLLLDEDFAALRTFWNRKWKGAIAVLYDNECGLCRRSAFSLLILDNLKRLELATYRDASVRKRVAPAIPYDDLDAEIHIRLPDGSFRKGFYAFRALCWHLPALWLLAPILYVPGVPIIGKMVYAKISERRKKCTHESCGI